MAASTLEAMLPKARSSMLEEAVELNWCSWVLTHGLGADSGFLVREQDSIRVITGQPDGFLNWVAWSDLPVHSLDKRIEDISAHICKQLAGRSVPCEWSVLGTQPNRLELITALQRAGWLFFYQVPGMTCSLNGEVELLADKGHALRSIRTGRDVSLWMGPFMEGFGIREESRGHLQRCFEVIAADEDHPFQHYLLTSQGGEPITTGSIKYRYGEAVIYNIATISSARGRGGATAMVRFLKSEAWRKGYSRVSLFALPEGRGIYEKAGFEPNASSYAVFGKRL